MQFYFLVVSPRNGAGAGEAGEAGEENTSSSPSSPPSPGNSKSPEQLSIMFPTQRSGLSILDKFKRFRRSAQLTVRPKRMLHPNER